MKVHKKATHALPLSARGKKRYILFGVRAPAPLPAEAAKRALFGHFLALFGERGVGAQKLFLVGFDPARQSGIVRCALAHAEDVKAGIVLLRAVGEVPVAPRVLLVSGTLAKLRKRPDSPR